jgi:hypothetical protein
MADDRITAINMRGVRKLIEDKSLGESVLDAVDGLLGAMIVFSPVVAGPAALPLLGLIEPKNELVKITNSAIKAITRSPASDYLDKAARMTAANYLLTYNAYFDALRQSLPGLTDNIGLTEEEKKRIAAQLTGLARNAASLQVVDQANVIISLPHPAALDQAHAARLALYQGMSARTVEMLSGLDVWKRLAEPARKQVQTAVTDDVPARACSVYEAGYLGMAVDYPQFFVWSVLRDQREKHALITGMGADLRAQFDLVALALQSVDLGLERLAAAIRQAPRPVSVQLPSPDLGAVARALHRFYEDEIGKPVIDDRYQAGNGKPGLVYPKKADCYVPQAYRLAQYTDETTHLEREDEWNGRPVHGDLGPFLMRYLESPYSIQTPLLILGHPGSGKSLLTEVIAARLAYPQYTTVRVELRDVNPDADVQAQIEAQIREDTGRDVNWADFAASLPMNPPIVILDGYDELLQATGKLFADYLEQVRRFQHREAVQHRPVRVIVTSRVTLIDKAIVPRGTTIVRLQEFDEERRATWTAVWNDHNAGYFQQTGVRPFELPGSARIIELAQHPLLLLMLAIYDSSGNQLGSRPDIDQTVLYEELLARFIERERSKGTGGTAFSGRPEAERTAEVDRDMERLGVAAIGMFNRQDVKIRAAELNADLRYFEAQYGKVQHDQAQDDQARDGKRRMSQADLLLGRFFFIHESRTRMAGPADPGTGPAAFEFLHNTFGEFLAADFIMRKVAAEADAVCLLSGAAELADTLTQRLAMMSPIWFACLVHTPLHTRPNILFMLRESGRRRLAHAARSRADLLKSLDMIVLAQLRSLLTQTSLPGLPARSAGADTPYDPLPVLGHLAIYSLNLVLLRCYLDDGTYLLDEADLGGQPASGQPAGGRPWDRLVSIWRSWFPLESLGALATLLTAAREGTRISIEAAPHLLAVQNTSRLNTAYNVGVALADNLTAVTAGLQVASLEETPEEFLRDLRARTDPEMPELTPVADLMILRRHGATTGEISAFIGGVPDRLLNDFGAGSNVPGHMLSLAETVDRLTITPRLRMRIGVESSGFSALAPLSRYEAELIVHARNEREGLWLPNLLCVRGVIPDMEWPRFLMCPAAAPVLRAGFQRLDQAECAAAAAYAARATLSRGGIETFDVDTAAALAVLAWRGQASELCAASLETVIRACELRTWSLLDIPATTWTGLADLFAAGDRLIQSLRPRFASLADAAIKATLDSLAEDSYENRIWTFAEFWIQALRIGATERRDWVIQLTISQLREYPSLSSSARRQWVFLLIRLARENRDLGILRQLFKMDRVVVMLAEADARPGPGGLDLDQVSADLTYREAMDLRWAAEAWRQAGN